jgi:hypothetical protein
LAKRTLYHNGRIYTQADGVICDSMAVDAGRIAAVGNQLKYDPDFATWSRVDLGGRAVVPGFVDAHTHFYFMALSLGRVNLHQVKSFEDCLQKIKNYAAGLKKNEWVVGEGYAPDNFRRYVDPTKHDLDTVTGGRPAFIFSHDQHSAWVNSKALAIAGVDAGTEDPEGGRIERDEDGSPSGVLRETAYMLVWPKVSRPPKTRVKQLYEQALQMAYSRGVTGVHCMDSMEGFDYVHGLAQRGKAGLRVTSYLPAYELEQWSQRGIDYGYGDDWVRVAGVKMFADGALGSRTALCFNKYMGSKDNYGIEVNSVAQMARWAKAAARLGLPCAIHAIGDKAVDNALQVIERTPKLKSGGRHRIEHVQLVRRKDIPRMRRLGVVASMQPQQLLSDINIVNAYWGKRGRNTYVFRTMLEKHIDLAFGSDTPIEPLDPLAGIGAAVRRSRPGSRRPFYPEQRISVAQAVYAFTVGPAIAGGQEWSRGHLMEGYPADFVVLSEDVYKLPKTRLEQAQPMATVLDGEVVYDQGVM